MSENDISGANMSGTNTGEDIMSEISLSGASTGEDIMSGANMSGANMVGNAMSETEENIDETMSEDERQRLIEQKARELEKNFSYDGYQVVRKELFAHQRDPALVIRRDSVTFNTACINGLEDTVYIQIMINVPEKKIAIRKCDENDKGALRWCVPKTDKRASRKMSGKTFTAKLYKDMGWDTNCRYKILGYKITADGQTIYIFDLSETEIFVDTASRLKKKKSKNADQADTGEKGQQGSSSSEETPISEETSVEPPASRKRRPGFFPEDWENSYGLPVDEHDNYRQINLKDGYESVSSDKLKEGDHDGE